MVRLAGLFRYSFSGRFALAVIPVLVSIGTALSFTLPPVIQNASAEERAMTQTQVKAAYIYNFTLFVEWPQGSFSSPEDPITVCVLADDQMADGLDIALKDKRSKGRPFVVKSSKWPQDFKHCHIAYVGPHYTLNPEKAMRDFSAAHVLVVGDMSGAAAQGAAINFYKDGEKIRFEVNLAEARRNGFTFSSRMLQLARIVGSEGGGE